MTTYGNSDDRLSEEIELLRRRILEYEQLEDELRRTQVTCDTYERRMASILSTIPDQVILHDKDLKIIWVNRAAARYLGLDPGEVPRVDCFALLFDRTSPCRECAVVSVLETGKP